MLLVLGPHRSGTSLAARMLECLGGVNSRNLNPANAHNPKGYFEDWDIYQFNERILLPALGRTWHSLGMIDWTVPPPAELARLRDEAGRILERNYSLSNRISVLKEPRMSRLLRFWLPVIERAGFDCRCVFVVRDPLSVARSLRRRDGMSITHAAMLYLEDWLDIILESKGMPGAWLDFDRIFESPTSVLREVAAGLPIPLPPDFEQRAAEFSASHLDSALRHSVGDPGEIAGDPSLPPLALECHRLLVAATRDGEPAELTRFAARARAALSELGPLLDAFDNRDAGAGARPGNPAPVHAGLQADPPSSGGNNPAAVPPFVQIFADRGDGYSEKHSACQPLRPDVWQTIVFTNLDRLHTDCGRRLRVDLINQPASVEVAAIRISRDADGAVLYEAASEEEFRLLEHSPGVLVDFTGGCLLVLAIGRDPQLWLPILPDLGDSARTLEIRLRPEIGEAALVRRLHAAIGANRADANRLESLSRELARTRIGMQALRETRLLLAKRERDLSAISFEAMNQRGALRAAVRGAAALRRTAASMEAELASLRRELRSLKSSVCHRATAPLRAAVRRAALFSERLAAGLPWNVRLRDEWRLIRASGLVRADDYFSRNPEAGSGPRDPVLHYLLAGASAGLHPHPLFDPSWYLEQNPDVAEDGQIPLVHFLRSGAGEGRDPHPLFDTSWYLEHNPDAAASGQNPLSHFLSRKGEECGDPHPLFHTGWYLQQNPDVAASGQNPLLHFLHRGGFEGRNPSPFFDAGWYLGEYPDVADAGWNPLLHYVRHGLAEGRKIRSPRAAKPHPGESAGPPVARIPASVPTFAVYYNTSGNYFFHEIALLLHAGLEQAGYRAVLRTDEDGAAGPADAHLIVAPHEFFYVGNGAGLLNTGLPENLYFLNTEQPQTEWFRLARELFPLARHIFDMDAATARMIHAAGFPASHLPLGYVENFAPYSAEGALPAGPDTESLRPEIHWWRDSGRPLRERPIDVSFVGGVTPRRMACLASVAPVLERYDCHLRLMPEGSGPWNAGSVPVPPRTRTTAGLSRRSKIVLNIHRGEERYFEWHRIVLTGIWQRALVVTEEAPESLYFVAGRDYVQTTLGEMPRVLDYYLRDPKGIEEAEAIRNSGYERLTTGCKLPDVLKSEWASSLCTTS